MTIKRLTALAVFATLITGLTACGNTPAPAPSSASSTSEASSESEIPEEGAGMANPVETLSSLEELNEKINAKIIRPESIEVSDENYSLINGDVKVGEYQFTANETSCTLRVAEADPTTDISGVYYNGEPLFSDDSMNTCYIENDDLEAVRWYTVDGQYTFVIDAVWDWEQFEALANEFMNAEPANWKSDVSFATYKEMEGYYKDDDGSIASINIFLDHLSVNAVTTTDEGNVSWSAECILKADKLAYETATLELNVYDEDKCETTTTPYGDEKAGFLELKDGSLIFSGVSSELFKDRTFASYDISATE